MKQRSRKPPSSSADAQSAWQPQSPPGQEAPPPRIGSGGRAEDFVSPGGTDLSLGAGGSATLGCGPTNFGGAWGPWAGGIIGKSCARAGPAARAAPSAAANPAGANQRERRAMD